MTSLANNPRFPDIVVDFTITTPDGKLHHKGSYRLSNDVERRACAERFHECLQQGYALTTRRSLKTSRLKTGTVGDKLLRAINDHSREQRA